MVVVDAVTLAAGVTAPGEEDVARIADDKQELGLRGGPRRLRDEGCIGGALSVDPRTFMFLANEVPPTSLNSPRVI